MSHDHTAPANDDHDDDDHDDDGHDDDGHDGHDDDGHDDHDRHDDRPSLDLPPALSEEELEEEVRLLTMRAASAPPPWGLLAARQLRQLARTLEHDRVVDARDRGWSWGRIARILSVSRQSLHRREAESERRRRAEERAASMRRLKPEP